MVRLKKKLLVNVSSISEKGLEFDNVLHSETFDIGLDKIICCLNPISYCILVRLINDQILVTGTVRTRISCSCGRCLETCEKLVVNEDICHYLDIPPTKIIDLTENLREDILIAFPQKFLCSSNCPGLCHSCGKNLNLGNCGCVTNDNIVGVLDQLSEFDL